MDQPLITVRTSWHGGVLVVCVAGEIDMDTAPDLRAVLHGEDAESLVLDLDGVTFFGSEGILLLLEVRDRVPALAVVTTRRQVLRTLEVTDLVDELPLFTSRAEALDRVLTTRTVR